MNRKLHNTILAFSFTGLAAVLMLLAASPLPTSPDVNLAGCHGAAHTAAMTAIGAVTVTTAAGVAPAAGSVDARKAVADEDESQAAPRRARLRHQALAMPYFSFAQGLRPVGS